MVVPGHRGSVFASRVSLGTDVSSRISIARMRVHGMASSAYAPTPSMVPSVSFLWKS
jgi:hypothetical protein